MWLIAGHKQASAGWMLASSLPTSAEPLLFLSMPVPRVCVPFHAFLLPDTTPAALSPGVNSLCVPSLTSHHQESGHVGIDFSSSQTPSWFTSLTSFIQVSLISVIYVLIHFPNYTQGRRLWGDNYLQESKKKMLLSLGCVFLNTRGSLIATALYVLLNWIFPCHTGNLIERSRTEFPLKLCILLSDNKQTIFVFLGIKVGAWWTLGHGSTIELQYQPNRQFLKYIHILKLRSANTHVDLLHSFVHPSGTSWTPLGTSLQSSGRHCWEGGFHSQRKRAPGASSPENYSLQRVGDCHYNHTKNAEL